jgi:hypothetical protein
MVFINSERFSNNTKQEETYTMVRKQILTALSTRYHNPSEPNFHFFVGRRLSPSSVVTASTNAVSVALTLLFAPRFVTVCVLFAGTGVDGPASGSLEVGIGGIGSRVSGLTWAFLTGVGVDRLALVSCSVDIAGMLDDSNLWSSLGINSENLVRHKYRKVETQTTYLG